MIMNKAVFNSAELFGMALHLEAPWYVKEVLFGEGKNTSEVLELRLAKRRARGYRKTENLINMIHFLCGKLKFDYSPATPGKAYLPLKSIGCKFFFRRLFSEIPLLFNELVSFSPGMADYSPYSA